MPFAAGREIERKAEQSRKVAYLMYVTLGMVIDVKLSQPLNVQRPRLVAKGSETEVRLEHP